MRFESFLLALTLLLAGCKEEAAPPVAQSSPPAAATAPETRQSIVPPPAQSGTPQPKLPTVKLWVGTNEISAEVASAPVQIATGMMWRTNMAEMEGMLFIMPYTDQVSFYMRNTLLPLTCAYIDPQGAILEIYDMKPRDETPIPSKSNLIKYVLEMNQGWFDRNNVRPGMVIRTPAGSLQETFTRRR